MTYDEEFQVIMQQLEQLYQQELEYHQSPEENEEFLEQIEELYELYEHGEFKEAKALVKAKEKEFNKNDYPNMNNTYQTLFDVLKRKHININNINNSENSKARKQRKSGISYPYIDFLDLETIILYGWETHKSDKVIEKVIDNMESGQRIKPLFVYKMSKTQYQLAEVNAQGEDFTTWKENNPDEEFFKIDGGHKRAVSNYIRGSLQAVIVLGEKTKIEYVEKPINIRNIILEDDDNSNFPLWKMAMQDKNYQ